MCTVSFSNYDFMSILMLPPLRIEYDYNFSLHGFQKVKKENKLCSTKVKTLKENKKIYLICKIFYSPKIQVMKANLIVLSVLIIQNHQTKK